MVWFSTVMSFSWAWLRLFYREMKKWKLICKIIFEVKCSIDWRNVFHIDDNIFFKMMKIIQLILLCIEKTYYLFVNCAHIFIMHFCNSFYLIINFTVQFRFCYYYSIIQHCDVIFMFLVYIILKSSEEINLILF